MADDIEEMAGPELGQVKIILNTLYLCIEYAMRHVAEHESFVGELQESKVS